MIEQQTDLFNGQEPEVTESTPSNITFMDRTEVKITSIHGRPMLIWVGKQPLDRITAFPAQRVESFNPVSTFENDSKNFDTWKDWPISYPKGGLLFHGDNKEVLAHLLSNGFRRKVNMIYIDPPFNTGVDYVRKVVPRGVQTEKIDGEDYSFTEQLQYVANLHIDIFLQFLYERFQLAKELLAEDGIIFIRMDVHFGPHIKLLADEVFGNSMFQNDIIVNRIKKNVTKKGRRTIPNAVDHLYIYFKSPSAEYKRILIKQQISISG